MRQAAISGISAERVRSDRLKDMLLAIANDPKTSSEERNRAIFVLEGFALHRSEYEVFRQAARIGGMGIDVVGPTEEERRRQIEIVTNHHRLRNYRALACYALRP